MSLVKVTGGSYTPRVLLSRGDDAVARGALWESEEKAGGSFSSSFCLLAG